MPIIDIDWLSPRRFALALLLAGGSALADDFGAVAYDPAQDALVVTMVYRGTNPDHAFSLKWGECQQPQPGDVPEIVAEVLDSQFEDAAETPYTKTVRFPLGDLACPRPMHVTLRTAPRFYRTITVPPATPR